MEKSGLEIENKPYYDGYTNGINTPFINIYESIKASINVFFSNLLFNRELNRVIYCKKDIAFRRRIELLDKGKSEKQLYNPVTLQLPFCSFAQVGDWEKDDRPYVMNAAQAVYGLYDRATYLRIRSVAVKAKFQAIIYVGCDRDVQAVNQILNWEQNPGHPIWLYSTYGWKGQTLAIPAFLTIDSYDSNRSYEEKTFLDEKRIFPVTVDFTVRSYQVWLPNINKVINLPIRFTTYDNDQSTVYLTEQTCLDFAATRWDLDLSEDKINVEDEDLNRFAKKYFESNDYTEKELKKMAKEIPSQACFDILKGYLTDSTQSTLQSFSYKENHKDSTKNSAYIAFKIKKADREYFDHLSFLIPGHPEIRVDDCEQDHIVIKDLYPNSTYNCTILSYSTSGEVLTYNLSFTTKPDENSEAPTLEKINAKLPGLYGMKLD